MKTYNLFISHSWSYPDAYERFINLLKARPYFAFKDYSVPPDDPFTMLITTNSFARRSTIRCSCATS